MVKIVLRERESAQEAVRRLRKILDRSGLKRELRRRERYEKPSAVKRCGDPALPKEPRTATSVKGLGASGEATATTTSTKS